MTAYARWASMIERGAGYRACPVCRRRGPRQVPASRLEVRIAPLAMRKRVARDAALLRFVRDHRACVAAGEETPLP